MMGTHVDGLDHAHVHVTDRAAAARWFGEVLGLRPAAGFGDWAKAPGGPLFLETQAGAHTLALFEGAPVTGGDHTIAFRTDASGFLRFLDGLASTDIRDRAGRRVTAADAVDHDLAWSVYFCDPDGNRFELTTYEHEAVRARLASVPGAGG